VTKAAQTNLSSHATTGASQMRAATIDRYGSPDVIAITTIDRPTPSAHEVLVGVRAAAVNPLDWHMLTGTPWLLRLQGGFRTPKTKVLGVDIAGVVEAVGQDVTRFVVGDEVFGGARGGFAEHAVVKEATLMHKPDNVTFEAAAAVPVAALTALQGLRDHGKLQAGQHVVINGASGGVGTYAVQLAKHLGAEVTGVCSTRNVDMVRDLGADHVVDYTAEDFTNGGPYDLLLDNVGNRKSSQIKRCLTPTGTYVGVGGPKGRILGPLKHMIKSMASFALSKRRAASFMAKHTHDDMELLRSLLASGELRSVIDTVYPLVKIGDALRHLETGRARGKIIVTP
jgi:NADPH:quinone reductase-like Zn-dependent oxidoreductase